MLFEFKLALKYFRARRKSLARFTSLVAVAGIAAGVASLILAQALARGFSDEMRDKILANTAHVSVFSNDGAEISNWRVIKENLEKLENVKEISATSYENSIITNSDAAGYAVLKTSSGQNEIINDVRQTTSGERRIIKISVGEKLAEKINLKVGDQAEIVVLENQSAPQRVEVLVAETFQTGLYEYDSTWIRVSPEDFAALHGQTNFTPTILSVSVADIYRANETAREIRKILGGGFKVVDWQEANQPLFAALSLERKAALAIISLIIFVAALNITTTLALLVNERKLDIAVLRTCGARAKTVIFIFLFEGLFLGVSGIFAGVVSGLLGCFAGNRFRIISLSEEVYSLSYIPFRPGFANVLLIISIAFLLCSTATFFPAFKASRVKPLENLRTR